MQAVRLIVPHHLAAIECDLLVFPAGRLFGLLADAAGHVGQLEERMTFGDDRFAAPGVPFANAGYGTVYDFDVAVLGMRGDTSEEVGDEKGAVVSALLAGIEVMDRRRRTVDVGLDLLPQLVGALLVRFQGFLVLLDRFERSFAPLAKRLVLVAVGVLRLFVAPVV